MSTIAPPARPAGDRELGPADLHGLPRAGRWTSLPPNRERRAAAIGSGESTDLLELSIASGTSAFPVRRRQLDGIDDRQTTHLLNTVDMIAARSVDLQRDQTVPRCLTQPDV